MIRKLTYNELKRNFQKEELNFNTTKELPVFNGIIGQQRAAKALDFGLKIKMNGYHIYVSGLPGTGKTTFATEFAKNIAKTEKTPPDLCYVYNFKEPKCPRLLTLEAGIGKALKEDMEELISLLLVEIPKLFSNREFEEQKNNIVKAYQDKRDEIIEEIKKTAKAQSFGVKVINTGIYFMPVVDGEMISEEQFDELPDKEKDIISANSEIIQEQAAEVMRAIKEFEKTTRKEVDDLEYNVSLFSIGHQIGKLQQKYADEESILDYLALLKEDILDNLGDFINEQESDDEEYLQSLMPWVNKKNKDDVLSKYKINLLTDNSKTECAPVIVSHNPTYSNLLGEIEYDSEYGNLTTDFMKIKSGLLHAANGGYLILQAHDVLTNPHVWETLRKVIKTKQIIIEPLKEYGSGIALTSLKPEPVEVDIKIIMVGTGLYYDILYEYDDDFQNLFRINAEFDYEMPGNKVNISEMTGFIKKFVQDEKTADFDCTAVIKILEYSSRLSERQDKLTTRFNKIWELLAESATWAKMDNAELITAKYVEKALKEQENRLNMYEEKLSEMIDKNTIMIDTIGTKVGQINGLAVLDTGDYLFAKPTRITATTYVGKAGIVNIEKEAEMSGAIHDKGVQVIIGYLGQTYAQDFPLSLSSRICFEQNYNGVDGDSASSTELYAILSSLAETPINQEIAVTGSINQRGEIQPIGGVTYKIEGFFDVCSKRGLTGGQGVIIPVQNISDLSLSDEVIEAVKDGKFHIYAISNVEEGIQILTGVTAGIKNEKGKYSAATIHGKVSKKLKEFYKKSTMDIY